MALQNALNKNILSKMKNKLIKKKSKKVKDIFNN